MLVDYNQRETPDHQYLISFQFALPFVERYHVREVVFTPRKCCGPSLNNSLNSRPDDAGAGDQESLSSLSVCGCDATQRKKNHSVWNCDGELHCQPSVRVTVHKDLIRIMARASADVQVTIHEPPSGYASPNSDLATNIVL